MATTGLPTFDSALIKEGAKCLNVDLMKFYFTAGEKLSNLSKAGSPHDEPQLLTGILLPWASRQAKVVALKRNISFIFMLQAINKAEQFSADMAKQCLGLAPEESELVAL